MGGGRSGSSSSSSFQLRARQQANRIGLERPRSTREHDARFCMSSLSSCSAIIRKTSTLRSWNLREPGINDLIQNMRCTLREYRGPGTTTTFAVWQRYWILARMSLRSVVSCGKEHGQQCREGPRHHSEHHERRHLMLVGVAQ